MMCNGARIVRRLAVRALVVCGVLGCAKAPAPTPQVPSPMVEYSRPHERVDSTGIAGTHTVVTGLLSKPVDVFITAGTRADQPVTLLVHFMGGYAPVAHAVSALGPGYVLVFVYLGAGSGVYERPLRDTTVFPAIVARAAAEAHVAKFAHVYISGFSAGYGAVRAILANDALSHMVNGALLLDGMHAGYVPDNTTLANGGAIDTANMSAFVRYARRAARGEVKFVVTHSEIFPGTYASTTETADYLLSALGLKRTRVLRDGPVGMQQTSAVAAGGFIMMGFAGNAGPDHIDHLHGMASFLSVLVNK